MADDVPFAFAGLWARWGPRDDKLETCAIVTTAANELCQPIHDRMPVILAPENYGRWLDVGKDDPADLLRPYASNQMRAYPVSTRVNSANNVMRRSWSRWRLTGERPNTHPKSVQANHPNFGELTRRRRSEIDPFWPHARRSRLSASPRVRTSR